MIRRNMKICLVTLSFFFGGVINNLFALENGNLPKNEEISTVTISSLVELETLAKEVNSGNDFKGQCIKLAGDINLTSDESVDGKVTDWESIGYCISNNKFIKNFFSKSRSFNGTFDGNGYTINCNVNNFAKTHKNFKSSAIFGCIGKQGVVKNLNIAGKITTKGDSKIALSGLCDTNYGLIENCNVRASVEGNTGSIGICLNNYGKIRNCNVRGKFISQDLVCAGIAGYNYSIIENCDVKAVLTNCAAKSSNTSDDFINPETGGISSFNYGKISECSVDSYINNKNIDINVKYELYIENQKNCESKSNDGSAGGIASTNNGLIENCTVKGAINAYKVGGIAAKNYETIKNCKIEGCISGVIVGGIAAQNVSGDNKLFSKFALSSNGGLVENCDVKGEIKTLFLAGTIICKDYWDDARGQVRNCHAECTTIEYKNAK